MAKCWGPQHPHDEPGAHCSGFFVANSTELHYHRFMDTKDMKLIGKGTFTKAYKMKGGRVFLKSDCHAKECMSLKWFPKSRLFPKIKKEGYGEYSMKFYERVRAPKRQLNDGGWRLYKELRSLFTEALYGGKNVGYDNLRQMFGKLEKRSARAALLGATSAMSNYGEDVGFEISPRNIGTTKSGNLVLLDCFFMHNQLVEKRLGL